MGMGWTMDEVMLYSAGHGLLNPSEFFQNVRKSPKIAEKFSKMTKPS